MGHILVGHWEWYSLRSAGQSGPASGGALKYGVVPAEGAQFLPASPRATTAVDSTRPSERTLLAGMGVPSGSSTLLLAGETGPRLGSGWNLLSCSCFHVGGRVERHGRLIPVY